MCKAENETLLFPQKSDTNKYPKPIPFTDGLYIKILIINGKKRICGMLTFLEGIFLGDGKPTKELFQSFGFFLAKTDLYLQNFNNHTINARQWNIQYLDLNKKYINAITFFNNLKKM